MNATGHSRNSNALRRLVTQAALVLLLLPGLAGCAFARHKQVGASMLDDKVTTERVEAARKSSPDLQQVRVQTKGGEVTLSGTVNDAGAREHASEVVQTIHRVTKLQNDIQVRP